MYSIYRNGLYKRVEYNVHSIGLHVHLSECMYIFDRNGCTAIGIECPISLENCVHFLWNECTVSIGIACTISLENVSIHPDYMFIHRNACTFLSGMDVHRSELSVQFPPEEMCNFPGNECTVFIGKTCTDDRNQRPTSSESSVQDKSDDMYSSIGMHVHSGPEYSPRPLGKDFSAFSCGASPGKKLPVALSQLLLLFFQGYRDRRTEVYILWYEFCKQNSY